MESSQIKVRSEYKTDSIARMYLNNKSFLSLSESAHKRLFFSRNFLNIRMHVMFGHLNHHDYRV